VATGARIHRVVVAFFIHLDAEALELLSGIPLHCISLLEAWQRRRTATKNASFLILEISNNLMMIVMGYIFFKKFITEKVTLFNQC